MVNFYMVMEGNLEDKVLLVSNSQPSFVPNKGELIEIGNEEFKVYEIRHKLIVDKFPMKQLLEVYLVKDGQPEVEVQFIVDGDTDYVE